MRMSESSINFAKFQYECLVSIKVLKYCKQFQLFKVLAIASL